MGLYYSPVSNMGVDNNGVVDDSERLGGQLPSHYLTKTEYDILTANRIYYVDPDNGDDSNTGLDGAPFATLAKAISILSTLDANGFLVRVYFSGTHDIPESGWTIMPPSRCRELIITGDDRDTTLLRYTAGSDEYCFRIRSNSSIVELSDFSIVYEEVEDHSYWTTPIYASGQGELNIEYVKFNIPLAGETTCIELNGSVTSQIQDCQVVGNLANNSTGGYFVNLDDRTRANVRWIQLEEPNLYSVFSIDDQSILTFDSVEGTLPPNTRRFSQYGDSRLLGSFTSSISGGLPGYVSLNNAQYDYEQRDKVNWDSEYTIRDYDKNTVLVRTEPGDIDYIIPTEASGYLADGFTVRIQRGSTGDVTVIPQAGVTINGASDNIPLSALGDCFTLRKVENNKWETLYDRPTSKVKWSDVIEVDGALIKDLYEDEPDTNAFTDAEKTKLADTEVTSQLNSRDTANRNRANHTGTQVISTVSGLQIALDGKQPVGNYATLTDGKVTASQLPPFVGESPSSTDAVPEGATNLYFTNARALLAVTWSTLTGIPAWIGSATSFGQSLITAANAGAVKTLLSLSKADVGLSNVNNTSDLAKPISTATQAALDLKLNIADATTIVETIAVHLSDNVTPVAPATAVEYYFLEYNLDLTGVGFKSPIQAPTGSNAIVRVLYNADGNTAGTFTNIFTSADSLTIPAGSTSVGLLVPDTTSLASGGVLRFDIQQVGATNTGRGYRVTLQGTRS
jgi:hypothetical protein